MDDLLLHNQPMLGGNRPQNYYNCTVYNRVSKVRLSLTAANQSRCCEMVVNFFHLKRKSNSLMPRCFQWQPKCHLYQKLPLCDCYFYEKLLTHCIDILVIKQPGNCSLFMDPSLYPELENIYGIDWSDYYIDKNSYNPIVFIHKKFLPKNTAETSLGKRNDHNEHNNDKCQQFDYDRLHTDTHKTKIINSEHKDPLVEQTIKFAKDIIPITIPPSTNIAHPCHYTVESCKKTKRKYEPQEYNVENKEKCKHTINGNQRKCKRNKDSLSTTSATHYSSNNTIDDINDHQLSCSLSEITEHNPKKKEYIDKNKKDNAQNPKLVASESFEAIAKEYLNAQSEAKIKIHLMDDKEKKILCENIRLPILRAVKECFDELKNQNENYTEMQNVNKTIRCHAKKLDNILEKLTCIENKLDLLAKPRQSPRIEVLKASKLEELGKDTGDFKEDSSEEELACVNFPSKSRGKNTPVTPMYNEKDAERDFTSVDNLARGENVPEYRPSSSQLGIKPERSNRIPARFCWTDTLMK